MSVSFELVQKYPWLPSKKSLYAHLAEKEPQDFVSDAFNKFPKGEIQERVLILFNSAFENLESVVDRKSDEINLYIYFLVKILLSILDIDNITNRIANLYSKIAFEDLSREKIEYIHDICFDLKLKIQYSETPYKFGRIYFKDISETLESNFRIHYTDYLKLSSSLKDNYRKLVNKPLADGFVFIQTNDLTRLIQEYVRSDFLPKNKTDKANREALKNKLFGVKGFKELHDNILNLWELKKETFEYEFKVEYSEGKDLSKDFPPCIKEILIKAKQGQNLIHIERLFLVFFLHALKYNHDKIISIFSTLPDFNREITSYQVEFAKKKGYTPHSCETLKSLNLCMATKYKDEICINGYYSKKKDENVSIRHPMFYVQLKQFRSNKPTPANENKIEGLAKK